MGAASNLDPVLVCAVDDQPVKRNCITRHEVPREDLVGISLGLEVMRFLEFRIGRVSGQNFVGSGKPAILAVGTTNDLQCTGLVGDLVHRTPN